MYAHILKSSGKGKKAWLTRSNGKPAAAQSQDSTASDDQMPAHTDKPKTATKSAAQEHAGSIAAAIGLA